MVDTALSGGSRVKFKAGCAAGLRASGRGGRPAPTETRSQGGGRPLLGLEQAARTLRRPVFEAGDAATLALSALPRPWPCFRVHEVWAGRGGPGSIEAADKAAVGVARRGRGAGSCARSRSVASASGVRWADATRWALRVGTWCAGWKAREGEARRAAGSALSPAVLSHRNRYRTPSPCSRGYQNKLIQVPRSQLTSRPFHVYVKLRLFSCKPFSL